MLKVGGRVLTDPALPGAVARWRAAAEGGTCIVHGGGDDVTALQRAFGVEPTFIGGRRVTSARDIDVLRMSLSGITNKRLVAVLTAAGVPAIGLSGEDGRLIVASRVENPALGLVGTPAHVNTELLLRVLDGGWTPVIAPLSCDSATEGGVLNVNADDAAAAVAAALGARELLMVADVPGILVDGAPLAQLPAAHAFALLDRGLVAGGMAAKVESAVEALRHGVPRVRIGDVHAIEDATRGTTITLDRNVP